MEKDEPVIPFGNEGFKKVFCTPSKRLNLHYLKDFGFEYAERYPYNDPNKFPDLLQVYTKGSLKIVTSDMCSYYENGKNECIDINSIEELNKLLGI